MICATLGKEIANLFSGMSAVSAVMLLLGLMLIIAEFFRPMRSLGYASGGITVALAVVIRMLSGANVATLYLMLIFVAFILFAAHLLMLALQKREWLLLSSGIADEETGGDDAEYSYLVGLRGITTTAVAPSGHVAINDINFYVTSQQPIDVGVEVVVKRVSGAQIIVEPIDGTADGE